jgi:LysR family nitrogen assimilation transcriptional regulator
MPTENTPLPVLRDLVQLQYFVRVAELGSFTKAASVLRIAQPALSRRVRTLEVALKANLFRRNGRGVQLTEAGQRLLDHAHHLLQDAEAAMQSVHGEGVYRGSVSIGLPPSVGKVLTVPLVTRFVADYPDATLTVAEGLSNSLQEQLVSGRLDVAVLFNPSPSQRILTETIATEPLYLIAPRSKDQRGRVRTLKDLASLPLIFPSAPHPIRALVEGEAARTGVALSIKLQLDSVAAILDLVQAGYGYSVVPKNVLRGALDPSRSSWHRIDVPSFKTTLCLATRIPRPASKLIEGTVHLLRSLLAQVVMQRVKRSLR